MSHHHHHIFTIDGAATDATANLTGQHDGSTTTSASVAITAASFALMPIASPIAFVTVLHTLIRQLKFYTGQVPVISNCCQIVYVLTAQLASRVVDNAQSHLELWFSLTG
jgi:hypothetical protein